MIRSLRLFGLLSLVIIAFLWPFHTDHFAIEKTNRFRTLANGWVSTFADIYLDQHISITEKIKQAVSADLGNGRFRPAFFLYVTSSYALSPLIHGRNSEEEKRPYSKLMNGDLRLFSYILLATISMSFVFMSLIIYRYTKEFIFSFIPVFFIPLSHALTFNLNPGVIDSQEIPVIFLISLWIFILFLSFQTVGRSYRIFLFAFSLIVIFIAFLTKETVVVVCAPSALSLFLSLRKKNTLNYNFLKNKNIFLITFIWSTLCSVAIAYIAIKQRRGYAAGYSLDTMNDAVLAFKALWS